CGRRALCRLYRGSAAAQGVDSRRLPLLECRHDADRMVRRTMAGCHCSGAGGVRRDLLLPRLDVVGERLPQPSDTFESAIVPSVERLYWYDPGKLAWGVVCGAPGLAVWLLLFWRRGNGAGSGALEVPARATTR